MIENITLIPSIQKRINRLKFKGYSVDVNMSDGVICMIIANTSGYHGMYSFSHYRYAMLDDIMVDEINTALDKVIGSDEQMNPSKNDKGPFLPSVMKKVEQLEMMGYSVEANISAGSFIVSFETKGRYRASHEVSYNLMFEDHIIEQIVSNINELIRSEF